MNACPARELRNKLKMNIETIESMIDENQQLICAVQSPFGLLSVDSISFSEPDILIFIGRDNNGNKAVDFQHISQVHVTVMSVAVQPEQPRHRIGFTSSADNLDDL